jgi:hypothetical protein
MAERRKMVTKQEALAAMENRFGARNEYESERNEKWLSLFVELGMLKLNRKGEKTPDPYLALEEDKLPAAAIIQCLSAAGFKIVEK